MSKKLILFFIGIVFFSGFNLARADVVINEIMYDPNNGDTDWVEIYNNGSSGILIKTVNSSDAWRISTSSSDTPTKYNLNGPDFTIQAGEYVILASDKDTFLFKHQGFSGYVVDITSSGFSDSGGVLKLWDSTEATVDSVSYGPSYGANNTGESLQLVNGSWVGATPTPGTANQAASATTPAPPSGSAPLVSSSSSSDNSSTQTQTLTTTETKTKKEEEQKIKTQITTKTLSFVGLPLSFQATASGYKGEQLRSGKYFWNFGDGDSKEVRLENNEKVSHTYFYPGEYSVNLEYYLNYYGDVPDASDKITIKVVPADIIISKIGDEKDLFVELANNTDYDADISQWILGSDRKSFTLPRNTILGSKNKIMISSKITNFSIEDKNLKLMTPQGEVVFDYLSSALPVKIITENKTPAQISVSQNKNAPTKEQNENLTQNDKKVAIPDEIPTQDLPALASLSLGRPASVVSSNVATGNSASSRTPVVLFAFLVFLGISSGAVYFIRQQKAISHPGDDFKILDE